MNSRHLVDADLAPYLDVLPPLVLDRGTLPAVREARKLHFEQLQAGRAPVADIHSSERLVPGPDGAPDVRVLIYRPIAAQGPLPAYLHIHGGGFVMGRPEMVAEFNERFARELGCVVVSVDYRLAPETPFPGAIEDCYAALRWLHTHVNELGVDATRIAIGGESAGAGFAAALALLARDRAEVTIVYQLLIYPMLDDRCAVNPPSNEIAGEFGWTSANNHFGWSALLGHEPGRDGVSPYAAPARAEDLRGLPPAYISVGTLDLFVDENIAYANRLMRAGVPTELHVYPGAVHGFELVQHARLTKMAMRDRLDALRHALRIQP
jgi:acetyl esterase/lipase